MLWKFLDAARSIQAPDIDFLNGFAGLQPLGQSALEIVKVHADEIKCLDSLFFQNGEVLGVVLVGEDAAVDVGMQRLHPAAEDFGEAGHVADRGDGQARVFKEFQRAAGGDELHAVGVQKVANSASPSLWVTLSRARLMGRKSIRFAPDPGWARKGRGREGVSS